ncbi:hypothetical protein L484_019340 [Morus notabilis]|uniref:Uncharacterized protein n=1 Tax=Morus notabilis TaxID=981085 RepID=W9QWQ7_9ROSA|nr:hypothetical protein L484_019340 [Morus notabilis]
MEYQCVELHTNKISATTSLQAYQQPGLRSSALTVPHPTGYLVAISISQIFSLGQNLPPNWGYIPKQPDSPTVPRGATGSKHDKTLTLSGAPFQGTWARFAVEDASSDYNSSIEGARSQPRHF